MHSVQSVSRQSNLTRRQRRRHRATSVPALPIKAAAAAVAAVNATPTSSSPSSPRYNRYKVAKVYGNTAPIVHGIIVSNISLVLLQKEYIEQFYFEKRSGGGGPDPNANADPYRHLIGKRQPQIRSTIKFQFLRFG